MNLDAQPTLDEDRECPVCGAEGRYVLFENDKVCSSCGHVPSPSDGVQRRTIYEQWDEWFEHRRENEDYSGFTGENRIKFVGGFARPYFVED